jgi:hypothetical protein
MRLLFDLLNQDPGERTMEHPSGVLAKTPRPYLPRPTYYHT